MGDNYLINASLSDSYENTLDIYNGEDDDESCNPDPDLERFDYEIEPNFTEEEKGSRSDGYGHGGLNLESTHTLDPHFDDVYEEESNIFCLFCLNQILHSENIYSHQNPDLDPDTTAVLCQMLGLRKCNDNDDEFMDFFQNASYCEDCQIGLDHLKTHFDIVLSYRRLFLELLCTNYGGTTPGSGSSITPKRSPPKLKSIGKLDTRMSEIPSIEIEPIQGGDADENGFLYFPQMQILSGTESDQPDAENEVLNDNSYSNEGFFDEFDPNDSNQLLISPCVLNEPDGPEVDEMILENEDDSYSSMPSFLNHINLSPPPPQPSTSTSNFSRLQKRSVNNSFSSVHVQPKKKSRKARVVVKSELQPGIQVTTTSFQNIPDTDPHSESLSCPTCFKILKNRNTYNSHKKYCQSNLEQCTCNMCGLTCQGQTHLVIHMEGVHLGLRPFSCDQCDLSFKTENALRAHHLVHQTERPYACQLCGLQFRRDADLRKHIQNVHQCLRPYQCEICLQKFKRTSHLKEHIGRKHKTPATATHPGSSKSKSTPGKFKLEFN